MGIQYGSFLKFREYFILVFASEVNSTLRALWLVHQTPATCTFPPRGAQAWRRALIRLIFEQFSLSKSNIKIFYFLFHFYVLANTKTIIPFSVGA